jgi:hypothetical protein
MLLNTDTLQVAYFDDRECTWRLDGLTITDAKFNPSDNTISYSIMAHRLAPMAVVQPRALDFPYLAWHIVPLSQSK